MEPPASLPAHQAAALHRTARLFRIITLVYGRAGTPVSRDDLALECQCDVRSIGRDIKLLRDGGIPLDFDEAAGTYTLPAKGWAYPVAPLTPADALALAFARALLTAPGLPLADAVHEALDRAAAGLSTRLRRLLEEAAGAVSLGRLPRDYSSAPLPELTEALLNRHSLDVDYLTRSRNDRRWRRVDPYQVEAREGLYWELHAWDHDRAAIRTFALDQIQGLRPADETFTRRETEWQAFLAARGVVGGLRGGEAVDVDVSFAPAVAPYARARRWPDGLALAADGDAARLTGTVQGLDAMLTVPADDFSFRLRTRRPPRDRVNALLSFVYALLTADCTAACEGVGLDPQFGFLHALRPGRASLALDLMEEFRPCLADRLVLTLINRRQIRPEHFEQRVEAGESVRLTEAGRKAVLTAWQTRKQEEVPHALLKEKAPFGLLPHLQARLLARHLRGDLETYLPFVN